MARVLLGWELGANRGHLLRLAELAALLLVEGHQVDAALQTVDGAELLPDGVTIWQAPVWPRLIVNVARLEGPLVATMGDILYKLGLDRWEALAGMLRGWEALLGAIRPDVAIADFAPVLLTAARGRVPTIAVGTSFERVPPDLERFTTLSGAAAIYDEAVTLDMVNRALAITGHAPLDHLPRIFTADVSLAGSFAELDAYAEHRSTPMVSPMVGDVPEGLCTGGGGEVFIYAFERIMGDAALWDGLKASGLKIRVYVPRATQMLREKFAAYGFAYEPEAVPWTRIAARSRLVVSHGGHGFVSAALLTGLPQVITFYDLEKRVYADCVAALGLGGRVPLFSIKPEPFADSLRAIHADDALAARSLAARPRFWAQMSRPMADETLGAVRRLAAG